MHKKKHVIFKIEKGVCWLLRKPNCRKRMKVLYSSLIILTIALSMVIIIPSDLTQTADATKATGVKNPQYGLATKNKVCCDKLCTPDDFTKDGVKKEYVRTDTPVSLQSMLNTMDRLFELHRDQATDAWNTLNHSEKAHMMKMFDMMYEKMQSMDFRDHMKHMSKMMDDKHHDYKDKGEHGCSCGEGEHGCSCGEGEHGCSCVK